MDPVTAGMIAAPIAGGIAGSVFGSRGSGDAQRERQAALARILGIKLPDIEAQKLSLTLPEYLGDYQAVQEAIESLGPSAMEGVSTDPRLALAQMNALETLSRMGETPFSSAEEAQLRQMRRQVGAEGESQRNAILESMGRRGTAGSGVELAAQLAGQQQSIDRASQESDRLAQMAQNRVLESIAQAGNLGGQIRSQEFGEKSRIADAADAIARFNAQNKQSTMARNVDRTTQAGLRNVGERQRIGEQTSAVKNYEQERNKQLLQQDYENRLRRATAAAGISGDISKSADERAARTADMWAGIGSGVAGGIAAYNKK